MEKTGMLRIEVGDEVIISSTADLSRYPRLDGFFAKLRVLQLGGSGRVEDIIHVEDDGEMAAINLVGYPLDLSERDLHWLKTIQLYWYLDDLSLLPIKKWRRKSI